MKDPRGSLYLLTGLILGLALGVGYAWLWQPVEYVDTSPASLRADFKGRYRALIAMAYAANGDLVRARARLNLLQDRDVYRTLAEQAQQTLAEGQSLDEARALGLLAVSLGKAPGSAGTPVAGLPRSTSVLTSTLSVTPPYTPTQVVPTSTLPVPVLTPLTAALSVTLPVTVTPSTAALPVSATLSIPTPLVSIAITVTDAQTPVSMLTTTLRPVATATSTSLPLQTATSDPTLPSTPVRRSSPTDTSTPTRRPRPTDTPLPTLTPTITPGAPFVLRSQEQICNPKLGIPLVQVQVFDAANKPVPGAEVLINWTGGGDHFFTGLKPELGLGYGDYRLKPNVRYSVRLANGARQVSDVQAPVCEKANGERYWGTWLLLFIQP